MSIIKQIYENRISENRTSASISKLDKEIYELLERNGYSPEGKLSDLFFDASGCGQQASFIEGSQIAVALMAECFT